MTGLMLAAFMEMLDSTVVNVSLPHIAGSLSATPEEATWPLTVYLASNAVVLPLTGWLISIVGRKRLLLTSIISFAAFSLLCGLSSSLPMLVLFRTFQGGCGAILFPIAYAATLETASDEDRAKSTAFVGLAITIAPMLGPTVGGWLTTNFSWPWVFYINVPIALLSTAIICRHELARTAPTPTSHRIDGLGLVSLALFVATLQVSLGLGEQKDWFSSREIVVYTLISACSLTTFVTRQLSISFPLTDLKVFTNRSYWTGALIMLTQNFVLFGSVVLLPLTLQDVQSYSSLDAGLVVLPRGLGSLLGMLVASHLPKNMDPRKVVVACLIANSLSSFWLGQYSGSADFWNFVSPQLLAGFSSAMVYVPLATLTMSECSEHQMVSATSLFGFLCNIGASTGIATAIALRIRATHVATLVLATRVSTLSPLVETRMSAVKNLAMARGFDSSSANRMATAWIFKEIEHQSLMIGSNEVFITMAVLTLLLIPLLLLVKSPSRKTQRDIA
jgi:DHA2 family multidrug resistance protein